MNNKLKILLLVVILLLSSMPLLSITAQAAPPSIIYQAPITIDNTQSTATPNPFQQMIQLSESTYKAYIHYNQSSANFEFSYANGTIIPSWIESNNSGTLTIWLKIYSIPASSSITIYIDFASLTTNLLSSSGTTGIGEAPQLSPTYGQYDNGASVFNFYDNFAGTGLNTSKWSIGSGGATYTVNNGLTVTGSSNYVWLYGKIIQNYPAIFDIYIASYVYVNSSQYSQIRNGFSLTQGAYTNYDALSNPSSSSNVEEIESALGQFGVASATITYPSSYIQSLAWIATGSEWAQINYANTLTGSNTQYTIANYYPSILFTGAGSYTIVSYWARTRAYPPDGVMPSVTFGTAQYQPDIAHASATVSYTTIQSTTSSTTTLTNSAVENTSYSTWNETDNNFWTFNSALTKGWANTTNASGYYVYANSKVWFNGSFETSSTSHSTDGSIGILYVNFTISGTAYTWSHTYDYSATRDYVYFDANITTTNSGLISQITFYQTSYSGPFLSSSLSKNFVTVSSATNTINSTSPTQKATPVSKGWSYPNTISSSFSSSIVSNILWYNIYWSAQYSSSASYNGNIYTSSPITGAINVYSISFKATGDYPVTSYTISYYLVEHYSSSALYSYTTLSDSYSLQPLQSHAGEFWNSTTISFSFPLPSDAATNFSASYKISITNLTLVATASAYWNFILSSQDFTYYSISQYKNTANITAYMNFSSAQTANANFVTSELINDYPSDSYAHIGYSGHGSSETLTVNATTPFHNETVQISDINWGDGSPEVSSAVEVASNGYYNFSFTHQYSTTGTFTVTLLIVDAVGAASSLSSSLSGSITLTLSITTTPNSAPVKTNTYIYFNYTQVNLNLQNVWLYINGILALSQNVSSNTNYLGSVAYDVPYYLTQTATFTALWEYSGGGISGSVNIEYSVANSVPTVGRWVILNYTIVVGSTRTNESIPYFYTQTISYNATWSYYVWQILLPSNSTDISVRGSPFWVPETISVPADFNKTTATYTLLINANMFQVVWLAPNPVGNALIIIQYYPESAVFGEFGVNIPFNQFSTFLNGKQIYSPTQQVILGQTITINTTTIYGTLISSYQTSVQQLTQFIEIPLDIVPLTIANMNSSYVIGMSVTQKGVTQVGQYLMPLESVTYYVPAGTYNFSFTYLNFNTYNIVKYLNASITISQVAYFLITGVTLTNINAHLSTVQNNVTNLIENVNISLSNSNSNIKNQLIRLTLNVTNTNSSISKQLINENTTLSNINTKITDDVNTIITDISNFNASMQNQFINVLTKVKNMNISMLDQFVNVTTDIKNLNSTVASQFAKVLTNITNLNSTVTSQFLNVLTNIKNLNTTMLSQFTTVLTNIKNLNSTVVTQFTNVLTNIKNLNSTVTNQFLNVLTKVKNLNTTMLSEYVNITTFIKNLNSSMKSQFTTVLTNIENLNSTVATQFLNVLTNIKNLNSTMLKQFANISAEIKNQNSTITTQFLNVMASIKNLNTTMLGQFVNVSVEIRNVNSSVASQFLNVLKNIKNLNATVMNEIRTNYYVLKFEDYAAVNSTTLQVTIYSFYLNGTPTSLSLTQAIAENLTLYYINSDNSTTLHYTIVSVSAGVMVIQIHTNIQTEMQLMSGQSVLGAKTYIIPPNSNNTALQGNTLATNFYLSGLSSYLFVLDYHLFSPIFYRINLWLIIIFLLVISVPITINKKSVKKNIALKHSIIALYTFLFGTMVILYLMYLHGVI